MDQKVEQMRSQSMSFSNNGMEVMVFEYDLMVLSVNRFSQVSINVPDTVDVKNAFGTVITTVVAQQQEIEHMTYRMVKMAEESTKQQKSIVVCYF
jgi:formylmethanofuran dehydrogenase subunit D